MDEQKTNQTNPGDSQNPNKTGGNEDSSGKKNPRYNKYYRGRRNRYTKYNNQRGESPKSEFKKLSIIVPLFNEEESINPLTNEIRKVLKTINIGYEVIFVDDGSDDKSLRVVKDICKTDKRFKYISFRKNYGKSAALQVGFNNATGDVIITMDADLQDDPNEIPNLIRKLEDGYDLVSGWKKVRHYPFIKKTSSRFFNFVTRIISGIKIHDFNCGLKAYRKEVTDKFKGVRRIA